MDKIALRELKIQATKSRIRTWQMIYESGAGHTGGDLSAADIVTALYFNEMNVDPNRPNDPARDRYVQSKGHAAEILWVTLSQKGFFDDAILDTYYTFNSPLIGHPYNAMPGIEMNTGSLGHGLPISVGMAIAAKIDNADYQVYTLLGDGELAEGSVWEGAMAASHYKLDNLTAIIDKNGLQITGETDKVMSLEPLSDKWRAFGWNVIEIDGNNMEEILEAFAHKFDNSKPKMIIASTVKGKGVSFAENQAGWHHNVPNEEEYNQGLAELNALLEELENE